MSSAISFAVAGPQDAPDLARLLREVPTGGGYALSFEREPDPLAEPLAALRSTLVIARDAASGAAVGMCERVVRRCFVDGKIRLLPYLGALRIAQAYRHRIAILKGGFALLREQAERAEELPFALTSIAPENTAAVRLLEAGVKGLPRYSPLGDYATLMMRPAKGSRPKLVSLAGPEDAAELDRFLADALSRRQFAPDWRSADIGWPVLVLRRAGRIVGCAGVWDQRARRQVVIRGYPRLVGIMRPLYNLAAPLLGRPRLPAVGDVIPQGFLSPLLLEDDADREGLALLLRAARSLAAESGLGVLTAGLAVGHPWHGWLPAMARAVEYRTRLYAVHWPEAPGPVPLGPLPMPEVGLL